MELDKKTEPSASNAQSQSERFIAKARELGLDEREETFDAALAKVARHDPLHLSSGPSQDKTKKK